MDNLFGVENEVVVITGVSGQMGIIYANAFLERNATVIGVDINQSNNSLELSNCFPNTYIFVTGDVTDKNSLEKVMSQIKSRFEKITVLINNAAIDSPPFAVAEDTGRFEDLPEKNWDKVIEVNLKGVFLCCQIFGSSLVSSGGGSIINISSIYGLVSPDQSIYDYRRKRGEEFFKPAAYAASKSALLNLTRYLAVYWAKNSIRVNSLVIAGVQSSQDCDFLESYNKRIPIGRMAKPEEYVGPVLFLASSASSYMTGSNFVVDGGWTAI